MENTRTFTADSEAELWQQVAADMARQEEWLDYSAVLHQGGYQMQLTIEIDPGGGFESGFQTTFLTARVPGTVALRFALHEQDWLHELGKLVGMTDIELGDPEIDAAFMITTNDPPALHTLLADPTLRQTLLRYPALRLVLKPADGDEAAVLEFSQDEAITEPAQLQEIYHLLLTILRQVAPL